MINAVFSGTRPREMNFSLGTGYRLAPLQTTTKVVGRLPAFAERGMDLRQLRYFIAVVESGSVAAAANRLNMPRENLYLNLELMRQAFGAPLLTTKQHQVTPTKVGHIVLEGARVIVAAYETMREAVGRTLMDPCLGSERS